MSGIAHRSWFVVAVDVVGISLYAAGMTAWAFDFVVPVNEPWIAVLAVLAAFLLGDAASGFFHWCCDTWGTPDWPIVGKAFIAPFREHHVDEKAITRHGFLEVNGASCVIGAPIVLLAWANADAAATGGSVFAAVFFPVVAIMLIATNQLHKWSHLEADQVPRVVAWLQARGLVLSPEHHAVHHMRPHDTHYCITLGWMNPLLDRIKFWRAAERAIVWITAGRVLPRVDDLSDGRDTPAPVTGQSESTRATSG